MSLASRGLRDLDTGAERVADEQEKRALAEQGRKVLMESVVWAMVLTGLVVAVPV